MDISKQKQKELEVEPWIPGTPFRPITPKPPVIYTDSQGNQIGQANIPKLNGFSLGLSEDTHVAGMVECLHPANCNWQATLGGKKSSRNDSVDASRGCSIGNVVKWNNASLDDPLLALADAASKEHFCVGSNLHINSHHTPESKWGMFAPVTPEKHIRIEFKVAEMQNSYMYAIKNQETDEQNGIATTGADANRLQTEELHKQATNPSFAAISTVLKEHHNSEKAGSNAIDLNKTPQQKPRRKRHRPKVITEGKPKRTQKLATPNSAASTGNPTGKRKYVRKKAINKASTSPLAEATGESTDPNTIEPAKKSCRRALNFDIEGQPIEASSKCGLNVDLDSEPQPQVSIAENKSKSTVYLGHGIEVMVQNTQAGIAYDLACSVNQMLKDYVSLPEKEAASTPFPTQANQQQGKQDDNSQESHTKGKEVTAQNVAKQITALSPNCFNCSSSTTSTEEGQSRVSKRTQFSPVVQPDSCNTNLLGIHYNALHAYQAMQFPIICKKKRTEKVQNLVSSSTSSSVTAAKDIVRVETTCRQKDPRGDPSTSKFNCWISTPQHKVNGLPDACGEERTDLLYKLQTFGSIIGQTARTRKKRSKGPTKVRDLASLTRIPMYTARQVENTHRPRTNVEALLTEMHGTWTTKKRTKRVSVNSAFCSINAEPSHGKITLYNQNQFSTKSSDAHPEEIWKRMCSVDAITEQLEHLNINKESNGIAFGEQNALVPYYFGNQMQNALVLYRRDGTIVPFDESFESIRKRRPRPKVDLDEETNRVWKLLMGNINSEGINGTDEEKEKWWEDERTVFCGRANSFIARMRLVQGDRRFSRWKGSVVDSVIGVFLTQNVSDHLSSSAFMSLAARFPLKSKNKPRCEERTSSVIEKPIVSVPDSEDTMIWNDISNQSLCDQSSMTVHDPEFDEEQEVVNSCESFGTSTGTISSESGPQICCQSMARKTLSETSITRRNNCVLEERTDITDAISSQNSVISSQNSEDSPSAQATERKESCSEDNSENVNNGLKHHIFNDCISFVELLRKVGSPVQQELCSQGIGNQSSEQNSNKECNKMESTSASDKQQNSPQKITESQVIDQVVPQSMELNEGNAAPRKAKSRRVGKEIRDDVDWDDLRKQAEANAKRERTENTMDSLDYEAARCADVNEIADTIKERGMNNMLAGRMKDFLNRLVREHGSIDLEWLRDIPPDKAKEYLLSFRGLGLKSVECVRLLTLHHLAFPVDTNVGRIAVRLGWVPLQPLPESLQLHLLELYPVLESIQKYLWPRLCKLDQRTLYELHYQMITFGKVFCTKNKPNCNACPMRGECRHFASAFASARLALPGPEEKGIVSATENTTGPKPFVVADQLLLPLTLPQTTDQSEGSQQSIPNHLTESKSGLTDCEPIIEEPSSPEPVRTQVIEKDIEDAFCEDPDEIPTIKLNIKEFTETLQNYMQDNMELHEGEMSKALVALTAEAASIPAPKLKNVSRLRTEHEVYELPDSHPLLQGLDRREPDDPCSYLLAIWTPGETASSIQPPERRCSSQEYGKFCDEKTCFSCNSIREVNSQIVRGTLLIPCRTAMRGSFPLNGTYFQVNEVFADHDSSLNPIDVPRAWLWKLPRRTVYFGTSIPTIFKGLTTEGIQHCFWRGYVCVRGFDQKTRAPRPLMARLHFPASKLTQTNKGGKGAQ